MESILVLFFFYFLLLYGSFNLPKCLLFNFSVNQITPEEPEKKALRYKQTQRLRDGQQSVVKLYP